MLRSKMLLGCLVSAVVLTSAGSGLTKKPNVTGPVQEMNYDETTDIILGLPNGVAPVISFQGATVKNVPQPADLPSYVPYPPTPCFGAAQIWNGILGAGLHRKAEREALVLVLQVMATDQCGLQIVRDTSTNPPTIVSITPIPAQLGGF